MAYKTILIIKVKKVPLQAYDRPRDFLEAQAPRFLDSRHKKVVKLSVLRNGRLYPPNPEDIPGTHFC